MRFAASPVVSTLVGDGFRGFRREFRVRNRWLRQPQGVLLVDPADRVAPGANRCIAYWPDPGSHACSAVTGQEALTVRQISSSVVRIAEGSAEQGWVESLRDLEVVISGDFRAELGMTKRDMRERALGAGARRASENVRRTTNLFVKGESPLYKFGVYGDKEAELALRAPRAWVIDGWGFRALLAGKRAAAWKPMQPRRVVF